jgi:V/A-type H+-transporting ATPase subunit I
VLVAMRRVDVVAPRPRAMDLVRALHRAGVLHLVPFSDLPGTSEALFRTDVVGSPDGLIEAASERIAELRRLIGDGEASAGQVRELWELGDEALLRRVEGLAPVQANAAALAAERVRLAGERTRTEGYRALIDGLQGIVDRLPALRGFGSTAIVVQARYRPVIALLRDELEQMTGGRCELIAADLAGERVGAALLYPERLADEVRALLGGRDLEEVPLPAEYTGLAFREIEPRLAAALARIDERVTAIDEELLALGRTHGPAVAALELVLRDRTAEARALRDAGASDHLVVVGGWIPAAKLDGLRGALSAEVGSEALVIERPVVGRGAEDAPVAFDNRALLRPFEGLASFVSVPRYGTIDPTPFLAITLPVFVGLMVGDVGYGLVLLALLGLARWRWPRSSLLSQALPIAMLAAGSTIAFGFLFGELFGSAGASAVGLRPIWFDRRDAAISFLALAIGIGAVQVTLGLLLGIVNAVLLRDRSVLAGRVALMVGLGAMALLLGWMAGPLPASLGYLGAAALVGALAVLVATLGLAGPIELLGVVGNILSYARLMAIGLASVMLALVANALGTLSHDLLVGAIVAVLLHSLNLALGFFDSSIQGLRLHYVEFFSKFVEPGGVRFEPFESVLAAPEARLRPALAGGT